MNRITGTALIVIGLSAGVGLTISANAVSQWYGALRQDIKLAASRSSQPVETPASPAATISVSASTPATSTPATSTPTSFESLSPCDQLDAIARAGKSVSEFLIASARVHDLTKYQIAISSACPWNAEQLQVADRVLNPPVIVSAPVVTVSGGSSVSDSVRSSSGSSRSAPAWNNCNGIHEPGESHSATCAAAQMENDRIITNGFMKPLNPEDVRDPALMPRKVEGGTFVPNYSQGYNAK